MRKKPSDDFELDMDKKGETSFGGMILAASLCVLGVCALVLFLNRSSFMKSPKAKEAAEETATETVTVDPTADPTPDDASAAPATQSNKPDEASPGGLTASDLDFWNMYPVNPASEFTEEEAEEEEELQEADPSTDGKHTLVIDPAGEEEWVLINPYLKKNTYDLTKFTAKNNLMHYYENGRQASFVGIDLNEYNGAVDYEALKRSGIDFCMLRAGVRGYESGTILPDKMIEENLERAKESDMNIGLYFSSQAINEQEAMEEAAFCVDLAARYELTYPIAYILEENIGTNARTMALRRDEKTKNTAAFCNVVKNAGYVPMVYGDKYYLLKEVELARLADFEIWFSDTSDLPDYPYQYSMWQYSQTATMPGVMGLCDLNILFVNYEER